MIADNNKKRMTKLHDKKLKSSSKLYKASDASPLGSFLLPTENSEFMEMREAMSLVSEKDQKS